MSNPIQPGTTPFGRCPENPAGRDHEFVDMGPALGPRRWRCRHCHRGKGELREEVMPGRASTPPIDVT